MGTSAEEYVTRRKRLVEQLPDNSLLILPSHPKKIMTHDIPFAFRQVYLISTPTLPCLGAA